MMSKKRHFPQGTTWQEAYDAFGELASSPYGDVAAAATAEQHLLEEIGSADTVMELESEILALFRRKYINLLKLKNER